MYTSREVYEFISKQTNDPIVEWKTCAVSGQPFPIYQSDLDFYTKISPTLAGQRFQMPSPTLCPEERERRRFAWRNEWTLYRGKCHKTGKSIVSMYPSQTPYTIYDWKVWYSDQRDPMEYGREYDFSKTFFENFELLNQVIPKKALHIVDSMENCEYCNYGVYSKSCYLVMGGGWAENCLYSTLSARSSYDIDGIFNMECHHTYQCVHCIGCYSCAGCDHSNMCKYSTFLSFCTNCDYCLGCVNMHNATYCILNEQYTKEEYEKMVTDILKDRHTRQLFEKKFHHLIATSPKKHFYNVGAEGCYSNYVQNGKNNILCTVVIESEDNKYGSFTGICSQGPTYDAYATTNSGYSLETCGFFGTKSAFILTGEYGVNESYYCQHVNAVQNCFGCIGLKQKTYCILNKQYTKEEYEKMVAKIITHMQESGERGENFPIAYSTFGYNETIAQTYYPLTKEEVSARGYKRQETTQEINIPVGLDIVQGKDLPATIQELSDEILNKIIICEKTGKPYRIIAQELAFYREHNIPVPTKHQDVRKDELMRKRMPKEFYLRTCDKCGEEMLSVYAPRHPEGSEAQGRTQDNSSMDSSLRSEGQKVYCEACYTKEVYG